MPRANTVVDVMLGEAGGRTPEQRYNDLLHVASVMVNRANMLGVPLEDVALNNQFNAFGQRLPAGVESYRTLAERALTEVLEQGPVTDATFYATPAAVENLPGGLAYTTETNSHRYFTDPQMRSIYTNAGYMTPQSPQLANAPTPTPAERWNPAVPGEVERTELAGVPGGLAGPSVTPSEGYGMLADTMGQTPSLGLSGAVPADRMASGPVAQGVDGLRAGLLSQQTGGLYADQHQMADMQNRANAITGVGGMLSYSQDPSQSPAAAAIESVAPTSPSPSLANAYGQLGQSLYDGGVLGLTGQKLYDPNSLTEKLLSPAEAATGTSGTPGYVDPQVSVQGPASPTIETQQGQTPPADVGSFPAAPQSFGQKAKSVAGTTAGALLGGAILGGGPVGPVIGGLLAREMMSGKGLFSGGSQPQSIGGLLAGMGAEINNIGQGARQAYSVWGGGTPMGTQAIATDGSRITSLGNGYTSRTDANGVTTTFNDRGNIVDSPTSGGLGGLLSGIGRDFSEAFGGGSSGGTAGGGLSPGLW